MEQTDDFNRLLQHGSRFVAGAALVAAGVLISLDNLGLIYSEQVLAYWPVVLVLIGILKVSAGRALAGVLLIVVGLSLLAYDAGLVPFTIFDLWPLLLILFGFAIVARAIRSSPAEPESQPLSRIWSTFTVRSVTAPRRFTGASLVALLGGCEFDLTQSELNEPAVIDVVAIWGGIEIIVPDDWEIVGEVVPVMGGFEITTRKSWTSRYPLVVRGVALMGGVEIKNRSAE